MSDMDEWRTHPCTVEFRRQLAREITEIGEGLARNSFGVASGDIQAAGVKYVEMMGYVQGVQRVIDWLEDGQ